MNLAQTRQKYGVPARKGMRVRVVHPTKSSLYGTIVGSVIGAIVVELDKPWARGFKGRCQWSPEHIQYLDADGKVIYDGCTPLFPQDKRGQFELFAQEPKQAPAAPRPVYTEADILRARVADLEELLDETFDLYSQQVSRCNALRQERDALLERVREISNPTQGDRS